MLVKHAELLVGQDVKALLDSRMWHRTDIGLLSVCDEERPCVYNRTLHHCNSETLCCQWCTCGVRVVVKMYLLQVWL